MHTKALPNNKIINKRSKGLLLAAIGDSTMIKEACHSSTKSMVGLLPFKWGTLVVSSIPHLRLMKTV